MKTKRNSNKNILNANDRIQIQKNRIAIAFGVVEDYLQIHH